MREEKKTDRQREKLGEEVQEWQCSRAGATRPVVAILCLRLLRPGLSCLHKFTVPAGWLVGRKWSIREAD